MTRHGLLALALVIVGGCDETIPPTQPTQPTQPTLPRDPQAATCVVFIENYVDWYSGNVVFDLRFQNNCPATVNIRGSMTLYEVPGEIVVDHRSAETFLAAGARGWLCGNGEAFTGCPFRYQTQSDVQVGWYFNYCYTYESECPYPQFPD